jgi:hypothetical protein
MSTTPPSDRPAESDFAYVDTAVGGPQRRNHVVRLTDFAPPRDARDVFVTYCRFTRELVVYAEHNRSVAPHKRPSVAGYRGLAYASFLPVDFDCAENPDRARADALRCITKLSNEHDVPPAALRVFFSGQKGFALELPGALFGGFASAVDVALRLKHLATTLFPGCPTLDMSIYEPLRLWRFPNSRHGTSHLFKTRLSVAELHSMDMDAIRALARSPRDVPDAASDDDWCLRAGLVQTWAATATPAHTSQHKLIHTGRDDGTRPLTPEQERALLALMRRYWVDGQKHSVALGLAGWLAQAGVPEPQASRLFRVLSVDDQRPDDRLRCLSDTYQRRRVGLPIAGSSRLREYLTPNDMDTIEPILRGVQPARRVWRVPPIRGRRPIVDLSWEGGREAS